MKKVILGFIAMSSASAFAASPCGLSGSIKERISDCHYSVGVKNEFQLVTRTQQGHEIYQGARTGVIWSADLGEKNYLRDGVKNICSKDRPEFGGLTGLRWVLPPATRYIQALKYGIQSSLPGVRDRIYWTSTADDFYVTSRYIFEGNVSYQERNGFYTFRHLETDIGEANVKCIVETIF